MNEHPELWVWLLSDDDKTVHRRRATEEDILQQPVVKALIDAFADAIGRRAAERRPCCGPDEDVLSVVEFPVFPGGPKP